MLTALALLAAPVWTCAEVINSVIEDYSREVVYKSISSGTSRESMTVTILNENGDGQGHIAIFCDRFVSLENFKGVITDADGKEVKKIA